MITLEQSHKAAMIFFQLLKSKTMKTGDPTLQPFFEDNDVRAILISMAAEAGLQILQMQEHLHLVSRPEGSVFATSFMQLRDKYPEVENRKFFYLLCLIVMIFLAEIDTETAAHLRWESNGVSYHYLEKRIAEVLQRWNAREHESQGQFSAEWGLAVQEMVEIWEHIALDDENRLRLMRSRKTRIGLIHMAMKLLQDEGLVHIEEQESAIRVTPKTVLYERLEGLYHDSNRYEELKELILQKDPEEESA